MLLEQLVDLERAVEILLIEPARHVQRRHGHLVQVRRERLLLPKSIIVRMGDEVVPRRHLALKVFRVDVGQGPELEVPLEGVMPVELEVRVDLAGFHHGHVFKAVAQAEGAVVMKIVAEEHICGRGLRRDCLECRMRLQHAHDRQPAWIADAQHADAPVVVRHLLHEPIDGVVGVGALVDGLGILFVARHSRHHKGPLRLETPANVLKHEEISLVRQLLQIALQRSRSVPFNPVRSAQEDEWQRPHRVFRREHGRIQLDAVAHCDHRFGLVESLVDGIGLLSANAVRREKDAACRQKGKTNDATRVDSHEIGPRSASGRVALAASYGERVTDSMILYVWRVNKKPATKQVLAVSGRPW